MNDKFSHKYPVNKENSSSRQSADDGLTNKNSFF